MHLTYNDVSKLTRQAFEFTQRLLYAHTQPYQDWLLVPTVTPEGRFSFIAFDPDGKNWQDMYGETYCSVEEALEMAEHYVNAQFAELEEWLYESD